MGDEEKEEEWRNKGVVARRWMKKTEKESKKGRLEEMKIQIRTTLIKIFLTLTVHNLNTLSLSCKQAHTNTAALSILPIYQL